METGTRAFSKVERALAFTFIYPYSSEDKRKQLRILNTSKCYKCLNATGKRNCSTI